MSAVEVRDLRRTYHTTTGVLKRRPVEVEAVLLDVAELAREPHEVLEVLQSGPT